MAVAHRGVQFNGNFLTKFSRCSPQVRRVPEVLPDAAILARMSKVDTAEPGAPPSISPPRTAQYPLLSAQGSGGTGGQQQPAPAATVTGGTGKIFRWVGSDGAAGGVFRVVPCPPPLFHRKDSAMCSSVSPGTQRDTGGCVDTLPYPISCVTGISKCSTGFIGCTLRVQ